MDSFIRYFARPKAQRPIRKSTAIVLTLVGIFAIGLASLMMAAEWGNLSWGDRAFWVGTMIVSVWMLPWTWANFFRRHQT